MNRGLLRILITALIAAGTCFAWTSASAMGEILVGASVALTGKYSRHLKHFDT